MNTKPKKQWFLFQNTNICYQVYELSPHKHKPTLIFIHGFLSSQYSFRKLVPLLNHYFDIITLDLPPFGDSDRAKKFRYSYENMSELIIHFMDIHTIKSCYLAGHSLGGQIALMCAYHYPDRINRLFLMAPSSYMKKASIGTYVFSWLPFFPFFLKRMFYRKGVYNILQQCISDTSLITKDMITTYAKPFLDKEMFICLTKMIRDREGDLDRTFLQSIQTKTDIFWGKEDEILPAPIGYRLVQDLPNATLHTYKYAGHLLPEEVPDRISDQIISVLSASNSSFR
ncbi:alpha/beta hydrolase [Aquibacillus sp. 3ASR75-11]|uniref:Alpha/beta hydrolase n=1 Tax=Terrihalobacillus insolitus TaxID=2950438 RepID=A0A9X4AKK0_9BACI|nr:alpha/beta hydrolase [Terrihalobacillus insolitus]MDC3412388.1 alpha/beta hydrolase [Terrihalobacillus insolitus]MDC3422919.1 alpha/beta hydrolase [Terrihalobacillus insolitus]